MLEYSLNGKIVKVRPEHEQQFLENNPSATLVQGKNQSSVEDATAEQNPTASDSQSGTTSSDSQKEDKGILTTLSGLGRGFAKVYQGLGSITEAIEVTAIELRRKALGMPDLTPKERKVLRYSIKGKSYVAAVGRGSMLSSARMEPIMQDLSDNIPDFDTSITEDFQRGDYTKAAKRTVDGFAESAASFVAAAVPGGLVVLAAGTAGNKYEEEIANAENDSESTAKLLANSVGNGTIEAGFEYFTRGLLKKTGIIKGTSGEAAKEFLEKGSKNILSKLGLAGWSTVKEGSSEAATELASALWDNVSLGRKINYNELAYRMSDAYIIGSFSGGVFESVGAVKNKTNKVQAESTLMDEGSKAEIINAQGRVAKLQEDLTKAEGDEKQLIYDQIKSEAENIRNIRAKNSINLSGLEGDNLKTYANNVDAINRAKEAYSKAKTETGKELAENKIGQLVEQNNSLLKQARANVVAKERSTIEQQIKEAGLEGSVKEMTAGEIESMDSTDKFNSKDASQSYGFIRDFGDGSFEIILNKDKPAIGVAAHEFLHAVLKGTLKGDNTVGQQLADALNSHVKTLEGDQSNLKDRLKSYEGRSEIGEETITLMSESILNGDLEFNESFFTKIGDSLRRFLMKVSNGRIEYKFETGRDVYNFIKDYNASIKSGKLSKSLIKATKEGVKGKLVKGAKETSEQSVKASRDAKAPIDQLGKIDSDGNDMTEAGMGNFLYQAEADQIISKIKEEGYLDNLIAAKYKVRPVPPEFVDDVLAELTPHIKAFKPESNDSLFGWIQSQIANKAGNVYNKIYKDKGPARTVDVDATTSEGAPVVQIEADTDVEMQRIDEMGLNDEQVQERSKFRRALKLDDTMVDKVINTVKKAFGTKLPNINTKQFKQSLAKAFKTDLKKPMQDLMGKGKAYDNFLEKFMPAIYRHLPVEVLVQMERNLKPELRIFTSSRRITKPTEVDKLISEGKLPKDTSRTSGPDLNTKLPYPGTDKILAFFRGTNSEQVLGYKKGASTYGTRKDVLAERTITEVAFDAVSTVIQDPEVSSKIEDLNIAGIDRVDNELSIIGKQIDRDPNIKFSKAPKGYSSKAFQFDAKTLLSDIDVNGFESVIQNGKLVEGYEKENIPQFTVDIVNSIYSRGIAEDADNTRFKKSIFNSNKIDQATKDAYKLVGNLRYNEDALNLLAKDVEIIAEVLGGDFMEAVDFEFLGFVNRVLDPAKTKQDGSKGKYYDTLQKIKNKVKNIKGNLPKGLVLSDINILNIGASGSLFKDVIKVLNKNVNATQKLQQLGKLNQRIQGANRANILAAKHISKTIIQLARSGAISNVTALNILQSQTTIVKGLRGLSTFDLIDVRDGSQKVGEAHPNYKDAVKRYTDKGLSKQDAEAKALKSLGFKGEHLGPNSNTMFKIAELIFDVDADIDLELNNIFRAHSQFLTSKHVTNIIDEVGGANNNTDFNRVKFLNNKDINTIYSSNGKTYIQVLADMEIKKAAETEFQGERILFSKSNVDYSSNKGMSTFDFDETLIIGGKNFVIATKGNDTVKISSEQWPIKGPELAVKGYKFDFSDFANVRGGKEGPLLQKMKNQINKYGSDNVFVLTARQQAAAQPIHEWLKSQGINIPLKNITGLGKSEGEAKAEWMLGKFAEGYNDMYFVDDAMPNVRAVKQVLDALDIKSKVVQAKIKFSKDASKDFNKMLERSKGVKADVEFSSVEAKLRGAKKGRFKFFVPPSAEDFKGLVYAFIGKGEQGNKDLQWFKDNLFTPFAKGVKELNSMKQRMTEEYSALKKKYPNVVKSLNDKIANTDFTVDNAIRVYLWNMAGYDIPGISDSQKKLLVEHVAKDAALVAYADVLSRITRIKEGYVKPADYWITQNIGADLYNVAEKINRQIYLSEWQDNVDVVFSEENLNKIEAIYGSNFREALEHMLYRMKTGSNRPSGRTSTENKFLNWINGSVGAVMFFNMRSALLQNLSMVNFLNFEDNNIFAAAKAFANQKQYWSDFAELFNSDMLKQRRAGLKIDVSASELTDAFAQGKNKAEAVLKYLLEKGFLPTQLADSFAIASGGATFYRNRINKYIKQGMSEADAKEQAFLDFQELAEETQQSSRPDLISMQQASSLGRIILAWANTPMQYTRLTKKALSDLINGRGDAKANVSRIIYYGAVQNIIFGTLQTGLAFLMFGDDEEDKDRDKKEERVLNGMLDTLLRGVGVYGALLSTAKNTLIRAHEELGKGFGRKDYSKIMQELISLSPPIGSKVRKIINAVKSYDFNKDIIDQMDHGVNNPAWNIFTNVVEGVTNAPVARIQNKLNNVREAFEGDHEMWQRIALVMGWQKWDLGIKDAEIEKAREKVKQQKKQEKKTEKRSGNKKVRCFATKANGRRCKNMTDNKNKKCYAHQ